MKRIHTKTSKRQQICKVESNVRYMQNWQTLNIKPGTTFWREADKQRVDMESNAKKEGKKKICSSKVLKNIKNNWTPQSLQQNMLDDS